MEIKSNHYIDTAIYLMDRVIRNLKFALKQKMDTLDLGITSEQFVVLDTISYHPNIHQQKLSSILMKDKSNTTRILKILEEKGLIKRSVGKVNNRLAYFLNVTKKGQKIVDDTIPKMKKYIEEIFENITDKEIELVHSLSGKIRLRRSP